MSFQQGLSGLNASSKNLEVIGNNVANANTFGAKAARAEFADVYATAMNGSGANNIGIGVNLAAVAQQFNQGNIVTTENPMDLAINGAGFFQVKDGAGQTLYSRNGQFKADSNGFIVNNQMHKLMGYGASSTGVVVPGTAEPLQLPTAGIAPAATTKIGFEVRLDSRSATTVPAAGPTVDPNNRDSYNNLTSMTVYDAKGQDVPLTYYFQKAATDQWNLYVTANGVPLQTDASGAPAPSTVITFPSNGGTPTAPAGPVLIDVPATTNSAGAATMPITGVALDVSRLSQTGADFGITDLSQDGYAPGQLAAIVIKGDGVITARYSNGQSKPAGQLELATFRNPQGLQPIGGNAWARTAATGDPIVGAPGIGNIGVLQSGALEESNTDLTAELVNMITAQRIYQANAQTIKTQDQVLQTLVNLR